MGMKEGWFNKELYYRWILDKLLPYYTYFPGLKSVIIINNTTIYIDPRIKEAIRQYKCEIRYLLPYSPDFNLIKLTFSMLKAWVRRYFHDL